MYSAVDDRGSRGVVSVTTGLIVIVAGAIVAGAVAGRVVVARVVVARVVVARVVAGRVVVARVGVVVIVAVRGNRGGSGTRLLTRGNDGASVVGKA